MSLFGIFYVYYLVMSQANSVSVVEAVQRIARAFPDHPIEWRIMELSEDLSQAQVRPQLSYDVVIEHLNSTLGKAGWSFSYCTIGDKALGCSLSIGSSDKAISKSVVLSVGHDAEQSSRDALVQAAEYFGIVSGADITQHYWVDYDPEAKDILFEPEYEQAQIEDIASKEFSGFPLDTGQDVVEELDMSKFSGPLVDLDNDADEDHSKTEGQQKIDRLVERLKADGMGLQVAKLTVQYGGYGNNPDEARILYGKLRDLLISKTS